MKKIKQRIRDLSIRFGLMAVLMFTQGASANTHLEFHEAASTVMINSLETEPSNSFLKQLYTRLFFVPVWIDENSLSTFSQELFRQIKQDKTLDITSRLYRDTVDLEREAQDIYGLNGTLSQKVDLEFKMSQLYKGYADYTLYGSINWGAFQDRLYNLKAEGIHAGWVTYRPGFSPLSLLETAAMSGSLSELFAQSVPKEYHYKALQASLIKYLEIQKNGGWPIIAFKGVLKPGESHEIVPLLRKRVRITGDYGSCNSKEGDLYDSCLKEAVVHFQKRHGLEAEGIIGAKTMAALNVPIEKRIEQIRLNLDRIKWLHERNAKRHIIINIPAFTLFFEEDKALRLQMKVITGTRKNPTPVFSNTVRTIVLNPHWNVPKSIIQKEMIPKIFRDPNAMKKEKIEIYTGWGEDAQKVDASSVNWGQYRYSKNVPYRFAQTPGYHNALGKVKFLFPNQFSVYMHDTPTKNLFNRNVRAFSHGCIRLSKPIELLETFSTFNDTIDFEKAQERLKGKRKEFLALTQRVPVDVVYLTAYVDYDGVLQFRDDIYGYDKMQLQSYRKW
ncbi:L,D-transpeptidase family protein [Sulfurovum sp. XTW-4]|uniref:L,D-transpeptidase family protein n=1 Tax=Sulfurovum xiamenensis TaxID=3019066 RepID=A0ABT7QTG7_9BACT|nr:L,D-transpeptidase family protein [Sulfurovum xiamenensis]MDM5264082.1 L,D-transpeptidase family protein [Sulfurovum xiamenensis]